MSNNANKSKLDPIMKIHEITEKEEEEEKEDNQEKMKTIDVNRKIPEEIFLMIIGHLNDIKDLRNCMLLSEEKRNLIFSTSRIMRKILFEFTPNTRLNKLRFLKDKGTFFKKLRIDDQEYSCMSSPNLNTISDILKHVPNLEDLTYVSSSTDREERTENVQKIGLTSLKKLNLVERKIELPSLKKLYLTDGNITGFAKSTQVCNIESLIIHNQPINENECVTNFLCAQKKLKEFRLQIIETIPNRGASNRISIVNGFPTRNIGNEIEFKLEKLELVLKYRTPKDYLKDFLKTQIESLKELKLTCYCDLDFLKFVFKRFEKLEKLEFFFHAGRNLKISTLLNKKWDKLKYFASHACIHEADLNLICHNLLFLRCYSIELLERTYVLNLETLEVQYTNCIESLNLILPNLKNFKINSLYFDNAEQLKEFFENIPNVEHFKVNVILPRDTASEHLLSEVFFENLKEIKNLKTLEYGTFNDARKLYVDNTEKSIKILIGFKKEQDFLEKIFLDFKFEIIDNVETLSKLGISVPSRVPNYLRNQRIPNVSRFEMDPDRESMFETRSNRHNFTSRFSNTMGARSKNQKLFL